METVKKYAKILMKLILSVAFAIGTIPLALIWLVGSLAIMINEDYSEFLPKDYSKKDKLYLWWSKELIKEKVIKILSFGYLLIKEK